jgi:hypothetical protein
MSEPKLICEVCGKNEAIGVAAVPAVPMSCAYCRPCLEANSHPMRVLVSNTAIIGGFDKCAPFWKEMVTDSLKAQEKTMEWFNEQVDTIMAEIDATDTLDQFIDETGA